MLDGGANRDVSPDATIRYTIITNFGVRFGVLSITKPLVRCNRSDCVFEQMGNGAVGRWP